MNPYHTAQIYSTTHNTGSASNKNCP